MTSRFVSGGTIAGDGAPAQQQESGIAAGDRAGGAGERVGWDAGAGAGDKSTTSVEWEAVQRDLEEERRRREEARKAAVEGGSGERSLYEILQANKAAKQAAFEEQNRIRNQFRALDDDEIDFLHGVSDDQRAQEERVRRETEERLARFRKAQQQAVGGAAGADDVPDPGDPDVGMEGWGAAAAGRKRKREKEKALKGVRRRTSVPEEGRKEGGKGDEGKGSSAEQPGNTATKLSPPKPTPAKSESAASKATSTTTSAQAVKPVTKPKPALGLVDYGSDEDDDD
ncbi:N-terminal domain of NEFA-interacting nuclear protein NIP30-domain-containing protein [Hypoxylon argillaceum]|nr:N-terminal domain of NEFA-interacting nuclear protein NIP30-domain-containing protein [Hypoxylon argillaceum]